MKKYKILIILIISIGFAQDITNKLGASGNYDITNSSDNLLLRLQTDNGLVLNGAYGTGTIPATGTGARLMWYPAKAAFRVGYVDGTQWNDTNIGHYSFATGSKTIASGHYSTAIGNMTTASGTVSTAMGNWVSTEGRSGSFIIGDGSTNTITSSTLDHQMTMRFAGGYTFYTNSDATLGATLPANGSSWAAPSDSTKKENFKQADGEYFLNSIKELKLGSWNYKAQDSSIRHYGPMAQEIYKYFGKDEFGTIGNDTTLATADMDGIMMIAIQALIKENDELKARIGNLEKQ